MNELKPTNLLTSNLVLLLSLVLLQPAMADEYDDYRGGMPYGLMMGSDMGMPMGNRGMMAGHMGFGMLSTLNLSKDQQKQIDKLHDDMRKKHWNTMGEIMNLETKLRDEYQTDKPDPKAVGEIYDEISSLRKQIVVSRVETMNKVRDLLTDEQREKLSSRQRGYGWGGGPMMRHGWR